MAEVSCNDMSRSPRLSDGGARWIEGAIIDAAQEITIQCGNSKIVLSPQAVTISAATVNLTGNEGNVLELATEKATLTGTAEVVITGPMGRQGQRLKRAARSRRRIHRARPRLEHLPRT